MRARQRSKPQPSTIPHPCTAPPSPAQASADEPQPMKSQSFTRVSSTLTNSSRPWLTRVRFLKTDPLPQPLIAADLSSLRPPSAFPPITTVPPGQPPASSVIRWPPQSRRHFAFWFQISSSPISIGAQSAANTMSRSCTSRPLPSDAFATAPRSSALPLTVADTPNASADRNRAAATIKHERRGLFCIDAYYTKSPNRSEMPPKTHSPLRLLQRNFQQSHSAIW